MNLYACLTRLPLAAALCLLFAASIPAQPLNSGAWRAVVKDEAPEVKTNELSGTAWTGIERKGGKSIVRWYPPGHDKADGRPVKFIVLFGDPEESGQWYTDPEEVQEWFECRGEGQWGWYVEAAADVCELVDLNTEGHYRLWLAIEYDSRRRRYFDGKGFIRVVEYNDESAKTLSPSAIRLPADYKWTKANSFNDGNGPDANGEVPPDGHNVVHKGKAAPYRGVIVLPGEEWQSARKGPRPGVILLARPLNDELGGRPVKFLLFFGGDRAKFGADRSTLKRWYECAGEDQWDWFLEVGVNVQQVLDPNNGRYRVWVAVEYESGLRKAFFGPNYPLIRIHSEDSRLDANCVTIAQDYKWPPHLDSFSRANMKLYTEGVLKAACWVDVHGDPRVGQYWEVSVTSVVGEQVRRSVERRQVVALREGNPVVEFTSTLDGQGFVLACLVDMKKKPGDGANVLKAWAAAPGGKPVEVGVMKPPASNPAPDEKVETKTGAFAGLEKGGGRWSGVKETTVRSSADGVNRTEITRWKAENGWFDGVVMLAVIVETADGIISTAQELSKFGDDGKPAAIWE